MLFDALDIFIFISSTSSFPGRNADMTDLHAGRFAVPCRGGAKCCIIAGCKTASDTFAFSAGILFPATPSRRTFAPCIFRTARNTFLNARTNHFPPGKNFFPLGKDLPFYEKVHFFLSAKLTATAEIKSGGNGE
jgi:hypothetical protein